MNRKFIAVMIAVWTVIALALIGLLVFFMGFGHGFGYGNWNWGWNHGFNYSDFVKPENQADAKGSDNGKKIQIINKSFAVSDISNVSVNASSADVGFSQTQGDKIKVAVIDNTSPDAIKYYSVSQEGSTLKIAQKYRWLGLSFFNWGNYKQRIMITLPESYKKELNLNLTSGDIYFDGNYTFAKASVYKTSGDINGGSLTADTFRFQTTSGDINLKKIDANYDISSTSGDLQVGTLNGCGSVNAISGDITFNISKLTGALNVSGTSGDIDIGIANDIGADIKADTTSGDVNGNFAMTYSGDDRNHATAAIGKSPYNNITVSTISGDINLNQK